MRAKNPSGNLVGNSQARSAQTIRQHLAELRLYVRLAQHDEFAPVFLQIFHGHDRTAIRFPAHGRRISYSLFVRLEHHVMV